MGANVTSNVQASVGWTVVPVHVSSEMENRAEPVWSSEMPVRAAAPVLVSVNVRVRVCPTTTSPKSWDAGVSSAVGAGGGGGM